MTKGKEKFNPLEGDTVSRDYNKVELQPIDIPEPKVKSFDEVTSDANKVKEPEKNNKSETENTYHEQKNTEAEYKNLEDLDDILENSSSEELAEIIVDAYVTVKSEVVYAIFEISEEKLAKKSLKGKFNMNFLKIKIPLVDERVITYKEYLNEFNDNLKKSLQTPNATKKKIKELLTIILEQRNVKISPEVSLGYHILKDVIMTTGNLVKLNQQNNAIIDYIQEVYVSQKHEIEKLKRENEDLKSEKKETKKSSMPSEKVVIVDDKEKNKKQQIKDAEIINDINDIEEN
jgi:hypothetical protein